MADLIQLLPDNIANQIAAGEVIQRPASVVKELVENAIDAGATKIEINIKDAGKTLIQVVDNGRGMSANDALLCFERHATSKVRNAEDLFRLTTKGFRGEALASIAAIAHVEMKTRQPDNELGQHILIEGSSVKSNEATVSPQGTSFEVKNLFFNVPARRNFLKKDSTEFRHIQDEFERIAFAHTDIHLSLKHNDSVVFNLPPAILRKRILDMIGNNMNDKLVPIEESTDIVTLKGFVLKPEAAKKTRGDQFFFVNDRFFKSSYFNHAVTRAFEGMLRENKFPGYFLFLTVDTNKIDVNVHPTKTEIKFEEEKYIYSIITSSIRQALGKYNIAPTLEFDRETSFDIPHEMRKQPAQEPIIQVNPNFNPFQTTTRSSNFTSAEKKDKSNSKGIMNQGFGQDEAKPEDWANFYTIDEETSDNGQQELETIEESNVSSDQFIVKGNYLLLPSKSGFIVIHTRRAIERIVYTEIFNSFILNPINSQKLLFSIDKEISRTEGELWNENQTLFKQLGFEGEIQKGQLTLSAVPNILPSESIIPCLEDMFAKVAYIEIEKGDLAHYFISSIAYGAGLKKSQFNSKESVDDIVNRLFQCEEHMFSPSGKKIIATLPIEDIEQNF